MNTKPTESFQPHLTFIVGPTATGKSSLAFQLAEQVNAHVLSADSRQVYKGLEITSGADIPSEFFVASQHQGHPEPDSGTKVSQDFFVAKTGTKLFGISLLNPTQEWSIAQFREYTLDVINISKNENKNLIIVGGSGLYLESLLINDPMLNIPPNENYRTQLETLSLLELQQNVQKKDSNYWVTLNNSDRNNPRRLIRALEKIEYLKTHSITATPSTIETYPQTWCGLEIEKESLKEKISARVSERLEQSALQEIEKLLANFPNQKLAAYSATGVKEMIAHINGQIDRSEFIDLWSLHEFQYAKRQMTWFKKRTNIHWFQSDAPNLLSQIFNTTNQR